MSGKLLMFAKLPLKSFIYKLVKTLCFQKENIKKIYGKCNIEKVNIYHKLTATDSTSLKPVFVSDPNRDVPDSIYRHILFEVITLTYKKDSILLTLFGKFLC